MKSGIQIENDSDSGEILAANGSKRFDATQGANGITVKAIAMIVRGRLWREKMMLAINENGAPRDIDDA